MNTRHKSPVYWGVIAAVMAFVLYPLSIGPACWTVNLTGHGGQIVTFAYQPIMWALRKSRIPPLRSATISYTRLFAVGEWNWKPQIDKNPDGSYRRYEVFEPLPE